MSVIPVRNSYLESQEIRLTGVFKVGTVLTDPTTVTLRIKKPDGTLVTVSYAGLEITKDSTGNFHYDYTPPAVGTYRARWDGTGSVKAAAERSFVVIDSGVI